MEEASKEEISKKKYPRNRVRLTDIDSAKNFLSKLIYDAQMDDKPILFFKNLTYMVQVFISAERLVNEKKELRKLVFEYVTGIWNDIDAELGIFKKDLKKYFDEEGLKDVYKLIDERRYQLREYRDTYKHEALEQIELKQKSLAKIPEFGTAEWKLVIAKDLIDTLPKEQFSEIIQYAAQANDKRTKRNASNKETA